MALPTPGPILVDENPHLNRGMRADGSRAKKGGNKGSRRALQNVSNISNGPGLKDTSVLKEKSQSQQKPRSNETHTLKGAGLKDKPILKEKSTQKQRSGALKDPLKILTDEEIKMCHEWAKDGVEGFHPIDYQKLDKEQLDKRVKEEVAAVNSALRGWPDTIFDSLMFPSTACGPEVAKFLDEPKFLELEPEILPDISWVRSMTADYKAMTIEDCIPCDELDQFPPLPDNPVMFKLRDDGPAHPQLGGY